MNRYYPQKRTNNGFRDTEETSNNKDADNYFLLRAGLSRPKCCHFKVILWLDMKVSRIHSTSFLKRTAFFVVCY